MSVIRHASTTANNSRPDESRTSQFRQHQRLEPRSLRGWGRFYPGQTVRCESGSHLRKRVGGDRAVQIADRLAHMCPEHRVRIRAGEPGSEFADQYPGEPRGDRVECDISVRHREVFISLPRTAFPLLTCRRPAGVEAAPARDLVPWYAQSRGCGLGGSAGRQPGPGGLLCGSFVRSHWISTAHSLWETSFRQACSIRSTLRALTTRCCW